MKHVRQIDEYRKIQLRVKKIHWWMKPFHKPVRIETIDDYDFGLWENIKQFFRTEEVWYTKI